MQKLFRNGLVLLVMGVGLMFNVQANLDNLKGTFSILPAEMKEFSVIHGAIAWKKGVIANIYDSLHITYGEPAKKPQQSEYTNSDGTPNEEAFNEALAVYTAAYKGWFDKINSPIVKLARGLFYRVPGTTSRSAMDICKNIQDRADRGDFAKKIAQIMVRLWVYEKVGDLKEDIKNLKIHGQRFFDGMNFPSGWLSKDIPKNEKLVGIEDALFGNEKGEAFRVVLLAALWAHCCNDRGALKVYYNELNNGIKAFFEGLKPFGIKVEQKKNIVKKLDVGEAFSLEIPETWETDVFASASQGDIDAIRAGVVDLTIDNFFEKYETLVYISLLPVDRPDDAPSGRANYIFNDVTYNFPDCMETNGFRNLFNHLAYNKSQMKFLVEMLREKTGKSVAASVKRFYETYADANNITDEKIHNAWTSVIENIPYAIYNRVTNSESDGRVGGKRGYVKVPEDCPEAIKTYLRDNNYIIIDDKSVAVYEIMPSVRNLVIALDSLLNLGLFESKDFAAEYTRVDFVKEYLPKAFESFGTVTMPDDIDKYEENGGEFEFNVNLNNLARGRNAYTIRFKMQIRRHCEFFGDLGLSFCSTINIQEMAKLMPLSEMLFSEIELQQSLGEKGKNYMLALCAQRLENCDVVARIVDSADSGLNNSQYELLRYLTTKNEPGVTKILRMLSIYRALVKSDAASIPTKIIDEAVNYFRGNDPDGNPIFKDDFSANNMLRIDTKRLLFALTARGIWCKGAIGAAIDFSPLGPLEAEIAKDFVQKMQAVACANIEDNDINKNSLAINLMREFIEQKAPELLDDYSIINTAARIADTGLQKTDIIVKIRASLLHELLRKKASDKAAHVNYRYVVQSIDETLAIKD